MKRVILASVLAFGFSGCVGDESGCCGFTPDKIIPYSSEDYTEEPVQPAQPIQPVTEDDTPPASTGGPIKPKQSVTEEPVTENEVNEGGRCGCHKSNSSS